MNKEYVSSEGQKLDITTLNSERLINSLALHHRKVYEANNIKEFEFHEEQISIIDAELLRREKEFYDKKIGGGLWT